MIKTTSEAEAERTANRKKVFWGLFSSESLAETAHKAREMGWEEKKVQVRAEHLYDETYTYIIEPFERDCGCPSILRYSDFFDAPDKV